jgi:hypothetical protein
MLFNYTTELKTFFDNLPINDNPSLSNKQVIENGRPYLFDFEYPIFDESYRKIFETHFIRNFYMRQIGFETIGLFKFQLETWLIINMPYFNKLFESELIQYDPLTNIKMKEDYNKSGNKNQVDNTNQTEEKKLEMSNEGELNRSGNETSSDTERTETERIGSTNSEQSGSSTGTTENTIQSNITGGSTTTQNRNEEGQIIDDKFTRIIESNTPDGRLNLTANDGEGVIEYASNIKENNNNDDRSSTVNETSTNNENSQVDSSSKTNDNTSLTTNDNASIETSENMNAEGNRTSQKNETEIESKRESAQTQQNVMRNETSGSDINTIEDYVNNKYGKIGTQTFAEMVQQYRKSFIRIEKEIFDEMNELFMLVY